MSRQKLHLHAGFHKTGSSAIQDYLYNNDIDPKYHYFHSGVPNSSAIILQAFKNNLTKNPQFRHANITEHNVSGIQVAAKKNISRIISSIDRPHTILSAESIGLLTPAELPSMRDFFTAHYEDVIVYIYLRPVKSRIESAFQEALKTRHRSLDQKFTVIFEDLIGKFDRVFGEENVVVSKYSKDEFPDGNVVGHFLGAVGINSANFKLMEGGINASLSLPAVQLLYVYRLFFPDQDARDLERVEKLKQLRGDSFRFHSQLYQELLATRDGDPAWLARRAGIDLTEVIEADDTIGIRGEADLVRVSAATLSWLKGQQRNIFGRMRRIPVHSLSGIAEAVRRL